jgi:hypothetical protein
VLDAYTISKQHVGFAANHPEIVKWGEGEDSLGAFFYLVEQALERFLTSRQYVAPRWSRYFTSPEVIRREKQGG